MAVSAAEIQARLDETLAEVRAQTSKIDGLNSLMDGMRAQIADLLAQAGVPQAVLDSVNAIFDVAKANTTLIDDTLNENVPVPA